MIVDTSAIVAIARDEPDAETLVDILAHSVGTRISAGTVLKSSLVLSGSRSALLDEFLSTHDIEIVPFDAEQLRVAREAHDRYGRGSGSPARLNFGDCFAYALAKTTREPLHRTDRDRPPAEAIGPRHSCPPP